MILEILPQYLHTTLTVVAIIHISNSTECISYIRVFYVKPAAGNMKLTFLYLLDEYLLRVIAYGKHFLYNVVFRGRHVMIIT